VLRLQTGRSGDLALKRLPAGRYRIAAVVTDGAGNRGRVTRTMRARR